MPVTPERYLVVIASGETDLVANPLVTLQMIAMAYYTFRDVKAEVTLASRSGGSPYLSLLARDVDKLDPNVARFLSDRTARDELAETVPLSDAVAKDFAGALCVGFSGYLWSEANRDLGEFVRTLLEARRPVAFVPGTSIEIHPMAVDDGMILIAAGHEGARQVARSLVNLVAGFCDQEARE